MKNETFGLKFASSAFLICLWQTPRKRPLARWFHPQFWLVDLNHITRWQQGRWRGVGHKKIRKAEEANFKPNVSFFSRLSTAEAHVCGLKLHEPVGLGGNWPSSQSRLSGDDGKLINLAASRINILCFGRHISTFCPANTVNTECGLHWNADRETAGLTLWAKRETLWVKRETAGLTLWAKRETLWVKSYAIFE